MFFGPALSEIELDSEESTGWNDYARITEMDYKAVVVDEPDSQGKIVVTERIKFDIHAASVDNPFWELWRDLCEDYVDGLRVHYKVNSVKQVLPNGQEVEWEESPKLYWNDSDYLSSNTTYGPGKWYHSEGPYNEYNRDYECVFFYIDGVYRDEMVFEIEYEMYNAVLRYGDCSDLYIAMYSGDDIKHLERLTAEILIPNKDMPKQGNYSITTYGTDNYGFPIEESATKNKGYYTFSFDLDEDELDFSSFSDFIEIELLSYGADKHIFSEYASKNTYYNDDALQEILDEQEEYKNELETLKTVKGFALFACIAIAVIVVWHAIWRIKKCKQTLPFNGETYTGGIYRDIPSDLDPKFAASLVFCKDKKTEDDGDVCAAILLSLAQKQYIELKELADGSVLIELTNKEEGTSPFDSLDMFDAFDPREPLEPLTESETHYFNLIKRFAFNNAISLSMLQRYLSEDDESAWKLTENLKQTVITYGINLGYFQKANYKYLIDWITNSSRKRFWLGIASLAANLLTISTPLGIINGGWMILASAFLGTSIYLKGQAHRFVLLTETGEREYVKWRGLYNFLKSDTLINERSIIELPLWEKYLIYATAFGVADKVLEAIKIRCPDVSQNPSIVTNTYCRSGRIRTHTRTFHTHVRHHSHAYHSRSSHSYGGGYGGGGRGGGGGGGGH